jgi:hypothetical protein
VAIVPDFRHYMSQKHPWVLDKFYGIAEILGASKSFRAIDQEVWRVEAEKQKAK